MKISILVIVLLIVNFSFSQQECFNNILVGENIISVTDTPPHIWAGTSNNGLISFDKQSSSIQHFNIGNSLISGNKIRSLLIFNDKLYLSTENSLMIFENDNFIEINNGISGILKKTPENNLAICGDYEFRILNILNDIIYSIDLTTIIDTSCCSVSTELDYDDNGTLWVTHYDFYEYDILKYDGVDWSFYDTSNSILPIESANDFNGLTHNGEILKVSNWSGLFKLENDIWTLEHSDDSPSILNAQNTIEGLIINAIFYDSNGNFWVAAGNYDNDDVGKIAYKLSDQWLFLTNESNDLPGANGFTESLSDNSILYATTNDGLFIIDESCLTLSTNEFENEDILVYPNPTKGILNIKNFRPETDYYITDVLGQEIQIKSQLQGNSIDISNYSNGIYFISFLINDTSIVKKIIVSN